MASADSKKMNVGPNVEPLKISLILEAIFSNLDLPELKTSRLVCREWDKVGVTLLGKMALLHVNKLFSSEASEPAEMTPVNDKLILRLFISDKFDSSIPEDKKTELMTRALTLVEKVSDLTREIKFLVGQKEFVPAFLEGIRMLGSTKIKHVGIFRAWGDNSVDTIPAQAYGELPPQSSLTSLKFEALSNNQPDATKNVQYDPVVYCSELLPLIKIWLDSAPNLTSLDVATSFNPNLEACTKLEVLKFKLFRCCDEHYRDLNVTEMLTQVKDSLIELELCHSVRTYESMKHIQLEEVPVMLKLTSLTIHAVEVYEIGDFFNEKNFPELTSISLRNGFPPSSLLTHLNMWTQHGRVHSLTLDMGSDASNVQEFGGEMVDLFPSVKALDLRLDMKVFNITDITPPVRDDWIPLWTPASIRRFMEPFQIWDLQRVNVSVEVNASALLIDALQAISLLKGDKKVQFDFTWIDDTSDNFSDRVQDMITHSETFKRVEIKINMAPDIVERLQRIVEASGAPIHFIGKSE
ncbi:uncharacterized protein LOC110858030 isoform X1 [Folsomia candida]|uniref:uncharacterized protein LOC110858030 isoform X1 n=1 Tax=Folsomia candida TaxID=158441 RepID=UPI000B8F87F2|nr:uncharacterized protein LOC110858030 isoform X1 [Folsomia candida]